MPVCYFMFSYKVSGRQSAGGRGLSMRITAALAAAFAVLCGAAAAAEFPLDLKEGVIEAKAAGFSYQALLPEGFERSETSGPHFESVIFKNTDGKTAMTVELSALRSQPWSKTVQARFSQLMFAPLSDKRNELSGHYEIVRDDSTEAGRTFEYQGSVSRYAKDQPPMLVSVMHESYLLRDRRMLKISCDFRSLKKDSPLTEELASQADAECGRIIDSVSVVSKKR